MQNRSFTQIKRLLHNVDPFENIQNVLMPYKMQIFSTPEMGQWIANFIKESKPELVIEVGCWTGFSSGKIALSLMEIGNPNSGLICVDTWLGAHEFWATENSEEGWWKKDMKLEENYFRENHYQVLSLKNGFPSVYYNFLSNMYRAGLHQKICPFPQTSTIASRWLKNNNVKSDIIYIDASHEYDDVVADLNNYWPLLNENGIMFGDDYWISDVRNAVNEFVSEKKIHLEFHLETNGLPIFWLLRK